MKKIIALGLALFSGLAIAGHDEGVYSYSHSSMNYHGAVTLVEKNGQMWAASNYGFNSALIGRVHEKPKVEFIANYSFPVKVSTTITNDVLHHTLSGGSDPNYFVGDDIRQYQTRQANSDTPLVLSPNNYYSVIGPRNGLEAFVINVLDTKGRFTGSEGNCTFSGKLTTVKNLFYNEVDLTYGPNCTYTDYSSYPYVQKPIKNGQKMSGVLIGTVMNGYVDTWNTMMLIMKNPQETVAVSRLLYR